VNGVKGKSILWFTMIIVLLNVMMVNVGTSPVTRTKLYIDPSRIPGPGQVGYQGDEYNMSVKVDKVENLSAVCFTVKFAPYGRPLQVSEIAEGDFLSQDGCPTDFWHSIDIFKGTLKIGISRLEAGGGASGSGTLMTFNLSVVAAGDSPIDLMDDILWDCNQNIIPHNTFGSYYHGATATLITVIVKPSRRVKAGENISFCSIVRNNSPIPLYGRVRFDIERVEDGRRIVFYAGQTYLGGYLGADPPYTYLYCDGYDGTFSDWTKYGDSPYLNDTEDGNYIESYSDCGLDGFYSFEDLDMPYLGIYPVISNVDFYGYTKCTSTDPDIDPYCFTSAGGVDYEWMWCDSMGGTTTWDWTGCRYYFGSYNFPEYYGFPLTDEAVDNMQLVLHNYHGDDGEWVDALRAKVEFATIIPETPPVYPLPPSSITELPPAIWVTRANHIGTYIGTATLEYSTFGYIWITDNQKTFTFWIVDP
jgi:hypothetical protein